MSSDKVNDAVAYLQKTSTVSGGTVYKELTRVIGRLLLERPENAVDLLETALLTKKTTYTPTDPSAVPEPRATDAVRAVRALYVTPEPAIDPATGVAEEVRPPNDCTGEDLVGDNDLFAAVGVGLGPVETYNVALAVQRLGENPDLALATCRFFGKLLGTGGDYYVYEATLKDPPAPPEAEADGQPPMEVNTGANANVYFVQPFPGGPTTQLPPVTPAQMLVARQLKRYLTGNLTAEVSCYPLFPGREAEFLRAQIGHIAAETVLAPTGFYEAGEDGTLSPAEGFSAPVAEDLETADGWVRRNAQINEQGRCTAWSEDPDAAADAPALLTPAEGKEWGALRSSSIAGARNKVTGVASLAWPGAFAVAAGGRFANIYVGDGVRNAPFVPAAPPPLQAEYAAEEPLVESDELPPPPPEEPPPAEEGAGEGEGDAE